MQLIKTISLSVLVAALLTGAIPDAFAQSGGFPAYSPEENELSDPEEKSFGFPAYSASKQSKPSSGEKKYSFPVAGKENIKQASVTLNALDFEQLGDMLEKMGLEPYHAQVRYDFQFRAELDGQEIELSLSAMLRDEGSRVYVIAWLDPLPAGVIPGSPLLEMLSRNEEMGQGLQFAYSKQTGRFLLSKTIPNKDITAELLTTVFQDVSLSVTENWSTWSTSNWSKRSRRSSETTSQQEVISEENFEMPIRR